MNNQSIIDKLTWEYKKIASHKECFHYEKDKCNATIRAHSIQRNGILSQLEDNVKDSRLLYSMEEFETNSNLEIVKLKPIGKSKASIFTGFCGCHDTIFSDIENHSFEYKNKQLFLYTYRGFAHSFQQAIELDKYHDYINSRTTFVPLNQKIAHQYWLAESEVYKLYVERYGKYKLILNDMLRNENYEHINYYHRTFNYTLIATSQIINAVYTTDNYPLNRGADFSCLILNVIPNHTNTIVLLSHFPEDTQGKIMMDNLNSLNDDDFKRAISSLIVFQGLNTFFSPKLWDKIPINKQEFLLREMSFLSLHGHKLNKFFHSDINFFEYAES